MGFLKNYKAWLVVSAALAVLAGVLTVFTIKSYVGTVNAAAAVKDIDAGQIVEAGSLAAVDVPQGIMYPDAVRNAGEVAGMVAKGYIPAGTILRKSMFMPPQAAGATGQLSVMGEGFLGVAVPNSLYTTVAGVLQSGNRVDIYTRAKDNASPEKLAQDIQVLQAGTVMTRDGQQQTQGVVIALKQEELSRILPYLFGDQPKLVFVLKPAVPNEKETSAAETSAPAVGGAEVSATPGINMPKNLQTGENAVPAAAGEGGR